MGVAEVEMLGRWSTICSSKVILLRCACRGHLRSLRRLGMEAAENELLEKWSIIAIANCDGEMTRSEVKERRSSWRRDGAFPFPCLRFKMEVTKCSQNSMTSSKMAL